MLESATRIDHVAYREINKTVESLQDDIRDAKEELAFYRGLVTSSDQGKGLTIQSFTLRPGDADHTYHYRIVLTRFQKDAKVAKGTVELSVIGKQEEGPIRLGLSDMMIEGPDRLVFQFKNFQKFEGYLILPTGFIPYQVVMTIDLKKKKAQRITKTVDWPSILEGV
ncbi:MAG: hypothetical protein KJO08_02295 [Gammaproteobacteria bacterium]|nr:hypothetical protein [Gammaproteobacteria bacterium]NNJ83558.1 hypothetical protein [Gammaproteobacteria bacterium]